MHIVHNIYCVIIKVTEYHVVESRCHLSALQMYLSHIIFQLHFKAIVYTLTIIISFEQNSGNSNRKYKNEPNATENLLGIVNMNILHVC